MIRVYTVCYSVCIFWIKEWSDQGLHCLDAFFYGKMFKFYESYRFISKSECLEFLWKVIVSQCLYPLNYGGSLDLI